MSTAIPVARLVLDDPRSTGYVSNRGYGVEFEFAEPKNSPAMRTRGIAGAPRFEIAPSAWDFNGVEFIHGLNAIVAERQWHLRDMRPEDFATRGLWDSCRPFYNLPTWLEQYNVSDDTLHYAITNWLHTSPPGIVVLIRASEPISAMPEWRFALNYGSSPEYTFVLPADSARGTIEQYPYLLKNGQKVDEWRNGRVGNIAKLSAKPWWKIIIQQWGNYLVLESSEHEEPWVYRETDLSVPAGRIYIGARWGQWAFTVTIIEYDDQNPVSATLKQPITIPEGFNIPNVLTSDHYAPPQTAGVVTNIASGRQFQPRITFTTTRFASPIVWRLRARSNPTFEMPTSNPRNVTAYCANEIRWRQTISGRGHHCEFTIRNSDGTLAKIPPLSTIQLDVGYDGETLYRQFTGRNIPRYLYDADEIHGNEQISVEASDETIMAHRRPCLFLPMLAGLNWAEAARIIGYWAGFQDSRMIITDDGYVIDAAEWRTKLAFEHDVDWTRALDTLCEMRPRYRWKIDQYGNLVAGPRPEYSGTPDHTVAVADGIAIIEIGMEMDDFINYAAVFGEGDDGVPELAFYRNSASVTDPTRDDFCGQPLWFVSADPELRNPAAHARDIGEEQRKFRQTISWKPMMARLDVYPEQFVQVNVEGLPVPRGTVFQITEKSGRLSPSDLSVVTEFEGVIVR